MAPAIVAVLMTATACGGGGPSAAGQTASGGESGSAPFGTACSKIPSGGAGSVEMMMTEPVVTAAADNPLLTSLAADIELAGLTDTLNSGPDITVFAPSNAALRAAAEADPDGMQQMMADPTGQFADLLAYHVVEGQLAPDELAGRHETLQGETLTVDGSGEAFTVNGMAMIVCGDIHTDNATV